MSLHPCNLYILLGAFILFVIFGIMTAAKAGKLVKKINQIKPAAESIQQKGNMIKEVSQAVIEKTKLDLKTGIGIATGIAVIKAVYRDYKQSGSTGMKQVEKSAVNVMEERRKKKMLKDVLSNYARSRKIA